MRKIILLLTCIICYLGSNAQVQKGDILFGGNFAYDSYTAQHAKTISTILLGINSCFFVSKHFGFGPRISIQSQASANPTLVAKRFGVFARPYLGNLFIELGAAYQNMETPVYYYNSARGLQSYVNSNNAKIFSGGIGYDFFISPNVAFEPLVIYERYQYEKSVANRIFYVMGFQFFLREKKSKVVPEQPKGIPIESK